MWVRAPSTGFSEVTCTSVPGSFTVCAMAATASYSGVPTGFRYISFSGLSFTTQLPRVVASTPYTSRARASLLYPPGLRQVVAVAVAGKRSKRCSSTNAALHRSFIRMGVPCLRSCTNNRA